MGVLYARVGGAWQPITASSPTAQDRWYSAWGQVAANNVALPADGTVVSNSLVLCGATSVTLVAGRRYRFTFQIRAMEATTTGSFTPTLAKNGTNLAHAVWTQAANTYENTSFSFYLTGDGSTANYTVVAFNLLGTAFKVHMSAGDPANIFCVEDIGPVSGAVLASAPTQDRWFSAWGVVATGTFVGTTIALPNVTLTQVTNALSFTSTPGRKYRVTLTGRAMAPGTTAAYLGVYLRDVTTPLNNQVLVYQPTAGFSPLNCTWKFDGDGTTKSYNCGITPTGGASTLYADNAYDSGFYIEDLGPVTGAAIIPSVAVTAWTALPLTGWTNYGGQYQTCQYRMVGDIVYLRGLMTGGTTGGAVVSTLPAGFRPPASLQMPAQGAGVFAWISIGSDGAFRAENGTSPININCQFSVST